MKHRHHTGITLLALIGLSGCAPAAAPSIVVNVNANVNVVTTVNFSSPIPASDPGCAAIGSIEINRPESLAVGTTGDLLITPKDSSGQKRTPQCDIADGITLSANPTDVLSIEDPRAFVTKVKGGPKTGTAKLKVTVGRAEASVDIPVR